MSFGSNGVDRARSLQKIQTQLCLAYLCVNGTSPSVLHRLSCSKEMVRNAPKYEFWVQWRYLGNFCVDYHVVTKRFETPQNMSFGSNGVDRVRLLRKIQTQLYLANLSSFSELVR
jgi:hypothetical protein